MQVVAFGDIYSIYYHLVFLFGISLINGFSIATVNFQQLVFVV